MKIAEKRPPDSINESNRRGDTDTNPAAEIDCGNQPADGT